MEGIQAQWFWIVLAVLLGLGYPIGLVLNRRLGQQAYRAWHHGLRTVVGPQVQGRWLGSASTGARLQVTRPQPPFRAFEVAFLLQTRELWPLWLVNRLRGRGDELVLRASLRHGVPVEWEIGPQRSARPPQDGFVPVQGLALPAGWRAWARPGGGDPPRPDWQPLLRAYGPWLRGVSLRRGEPHLIVRLNLAAARTPDDAAALLRTLARLWSADAASGAAS